MSDRDGRLNAAADIQGSTGVRSLYRTVYRVAEQPASPALVYSESDDHDRQRQDLAFLRREGGAEAWIETCTATPWERTDD